MAGGEFIGRLAVPLARAAGALTRVGAVPVDDLVVHFGALKTGSSAIQAVLRDNLRPWCGYVYPDLGQANGSLTLAFAFATPDSLRLWNFVQSGAVAAAQRLRMQARLGLALRAARPGVPVILSGEVVATFRRGRSCRAGSVRKHGAAVPLHRLPPRAGIGADLDFSGDGQGYLAHPPFPDAGHAGWVLPLHDA